ncbi:uncharacterized protein VTP21DRAFT_5933 [Calcarisporiella thermophila]|uniref:uncharacterized protein n=1 Tax=Calcarisporiella thermophila TaxID=911321 RepID=UPI00374410C8
MFFRSSEEPFDYTTDNDIGHHQFMDEDHEDRAGSESSDSTQYEEESERVSESNDENPSDISSEEESEVEELYKMDEETIKAIELFKLKIKHSLSDEAYEDISELLGIGGISQYRIKKMLQAYVDIKPVLTDCCVRSCVAFTREYAHLESC